MLLKQTENVIRPAMFQLKLYVVVQLNKTSKFDRSVEVLWD